MGMSVPIKNGINQAANPLPLEAIAQR